MIKIRAFVVLLLSVVSKRTAANLYIDGHLSTYTAKWELGWTFFRLLSLLAAYMDIFPSKLPLEWFIQKPRSSKPLDKREQNGQNRSTGISIL